MVKSEPSMEVYESKECISNQLINEGDLIYLVGLIISKRDAPVSKREVAALITGIREGYAFAEWKLRQVKSKNGDTLSED